MKNNQLDNFENFIKDSLAENEVPFNPSDWDSLNQRLDAKSAKPFYKNNWFLAASLFVGVVVSVLTYISLNDVPKELVTNDSDNSTKEKSPVAVDSNSKTDNTTKDVISHIENISDDFAKEEFLKAEKITNTNSTTISETEELNDLEPIDSNVLADNTDSKFDETNRFESDSEIKPVEENPHAEQITIPSADFYPSLVDGCEGVTIQFTTEKQKNVDYLWKFDDGSYSNEMNPKHAYSKSGTYNVTLIVRSTKDNSIMKKSREQSIVIYPKPKIDFEWELVEENGIPSISFENNTTQGSKWNWAFGDGNKSSNKNPLHTYRKKGVYSVSLTAISEENCTSSLNKEISVDDDYNLLAPNSFTPNGDGTNDYFIPAALNRFNGNFIMTIYSATDGLIYETENINQPWDGINQKTGERCKEGQYVWVVKLTNEKGEIENYKGALLLLK